MKTYELLLTEAELNLIVGVLGKAPYEQVFQLIQNLGNQIAQQRVKQDDIPQG